MNDTAFFITHNIFLTENQTKMLVSGESVETTGNCVPVWVDAKTGLTTEPAKEIFCLYRIHNIVDSERDVKIIPRKGYEIFLPHSSWSPPPEINLDEASGWSSEERKLHMEEMEKWWFNNPKPPDSSNLSGGYLRFEVKKTYGKDKVKYPEQHIVEISLWDRLLESLAT